MRHPHKYEKSLKITFSFTVRASICRSLRTLLTSNQYALDCSMAVIGYLMFGDWTRDEITSNLVTTKGYPRFLSIVVVVLIAIIPLTKVPLRLET